MPASRPVLVPSRTPYSFRGRLHVVRPLDVVLRGRLILVVLPVVLRAVQRVRGILHRRNPGVAYEPDDPVHLPIGREVEAPGLEGLRPQPGQPWAAKKEMICPLRYLPAQPAEARDRRPTPEVLQS